jgi:dihydrofolate reductase
MRKVIVSVYSTLDGVIQPVDWSFQFWNEEHGSYAREQLFNADALMMGRGTYEVFASSWPLRSAADDAPGAPGFVDRINSIRKYVASTTLKAPLAWNNSTLIEGDLAQTAAGLKQEAGQNILIYGAGSVAHTLLLNGLVDEIQIWMYPVVRGDGERLFNSARDIPVLKLVDTKRLTTGVVILTYVPPK